MESFSVGEVAPTGARPITGLVSRLLLCPGGPTTDLPPCAIGRVLVGSEHQRAAVDRHVDSATERSDGHDVTSLVVDHRGDGA